MSLRKNNRGVIRLNDTTDHGGEVVQVKHTQVRVLDRPVAVIGDLVRCPKCNGVYEIVEGEPDHRIQDDNVAYEGHRTACGAVLISSV